MMTFLFLHSLTLSLQHLGAFLLWDLLAFLGCDVMANVFVVNLLTNLFSHWITFLGIESSALTARDILKNVFKKLFGMHFIKML